jgi:cell division protein FtsB
MFNFDRHSIRRHFLRLLKNKYFSTALVFLLWVGLFDENNLIERYKLIKELHQLEKDKIYYQQKIEIDAARLNELQTNNENLEKFAREQYLMHRENEDVFVIVRH